MKNIFKVTFMATALLAVVGCGKEFLEKEPSQFLTSDQVDDAGSRNPDVLAGTLTGIYQLTLDAFTGGTESHTDFGHKAYDLQSDMLTGDVALSISTYGWYRADITEFIGPLDFTRLANYQPWRYYYRVIRSANIVIAALGGNDAVPEIEGNRHNLAQAKTLRAHSYFYLTQYFQNSYEPSQLILPIYTNPDDVNGPKVSAQEIYDLIESDLNSALELFEGFNRGQKSQINADVAKGILAYVHGAKGEWQEVYDLTKEVLDAGNHSILSEEQLTGGFNDLSTSSWMWGVDLTSDVGLGLVSWWGQMDYYTYSYAWAGDAKAIDASLYANIPADDVRKGQFQPPGSGYTSLMPLNKFYDPNKIIGGQAPVTTDYVYMRIEEMYLLNAEAAAHLGMTAEAVSVMKEVLGNRVADLSYLDGLSGQALLDEIYLQTRIEFWGEGKSYLAMKRNKATIVRGSNHLSYIGVPIPYDDERLTFEIPEAELQANPLITDQNN